MPPRKTSWFYRICTEYEENEIKDTYGIADELLRESDGKDCKITMGTSTP